MQKNFMQLLPEIRAGQLVDEITDKMAMVVSQVRAMEKGGKLTVEFDIQPANAGGNAMAITTKVTTKLPEKKGKAVILFCDNEGSLHRNDPDDLFHPNRIKEVAKNVSVLGEKPAVNIDPETGEVLEQKATA